MLQRPAEISILFIEFERVSNVTEVSLILPVPLHSHQPHGSRLETELVRCQGSERPSELQIQSECTMISDQREGEEPC